MEMKSTLTTVCCNLTWPRIKLKNSQLIRNCPVQKLATGSTWTSGPRTFKDFWRKCSNTS